MVRASYRSNNDLYELVNATLDNVDEDMVFALQDGTEVDTEYKERMIESVNQGLGFRLLKNGKRIGVMYNAVIDGEYVGCSIYCKNDRVGMVIILKSMFEAYDWHKILVTPHDDGLKYFISMATGSSIKEYHLYGTPLVIVKNLIWNDGYRAFKYLGIEEL